MARMLHIDPDEYLLDSFRLGKRVYESGFRPTHAISLWRGGTPVGLGVDAFFRSRGVMINHTTIATESYVGIDEHGETIVKNLEHLVQAVCPEHDLLIIDDVYERGETIRRVVERLRRRARANTPRNIRVATVHHKPKRSTYDELPLISLHDIDEDVWIDYPHELADLVDPNDPEDERIRTKDAAIWSALREAPADGPITVDDEGRGYIYVSAKQALLDAVRLGVMISHDDWHPDFLIALWPGGVLAGLPVHEVYKYFLKKSGSSRKPPDHISINTQPTRLTYKSNVVGIQYLEDHVEEHHKVLIIDTTFRAGKLVHDVAARLKEGLRRNFDHKGLRVASIYHNPHDSSTWTARPFIDKPDYFLKTVAKEVIYPASIHKMLPDPRRELKALDAKLWEIVYGDG